MKKNVASQKIGAQMLNATTGADFTGAVTVSVTGDAGTQATGSVGSGACVHEGHGYHTYAPDIAETNFDLVAFTFYGTGAITVTVQVFTSFPQGGDNFARLGAPAGASVSVDIAAAKVDTAAIKTKTDFLPSFTAGAAGGVFIAGTNAATAVAITGNITGNISGAVGSVTGAVGSVTGLTAADVGAIKAKTDNLPTDPADQSLIIDATNAIVTILGTPAGASIAADIATKATVLMLTAVRDVVVTKMDPMLQSDGGGGWQWTQTAGDDFVAHLSAGEQNDLADAILDRDIAGGATGGRSVKEALYVLRNKTAIAAGTLTVYGADDTTPAFTAAVTTAAGNPITSIDPA